MVNNFSITYYTFLCIVCVLTAKPNQHTGKLKDAKPKFDPEKVGNIFKEEAI